jgi:hypothetical protein
VRAKASASFARSDRSPRSPRASAAKVALDVIGYPLNQARVIDLVECAGDFTAIRTRGRISIPAKAIDLMEEAAVVQNAVVDPAEYVAQPLEAGRAEAPDPFGRTGVPAP